MFTHSSGRSTNAGEKDLRSCIFNDAAQVSHNLRYVSCFKTSVPKQWRSRLTWAQDEKSQRRANNSKADTPRSASMADTSAPGSTVEASASGSKANTSASGHALTEDRPTVNSVSSALQRWKNEVPEEEHWNKVGYFAKMEASEK